MYLDVIAVTQTSELLLTSCIPHVESKLIDVWNQNQLHEQKTVSWSVNLRISEPFPWQTLLFQEKSQALHQKRDEAQKFQCSGSEINNFGSGSSNWKSGISDMDRSVAWDGEKIIVNFGYYEDTNGLKSWTFYIFQVLCMKLWWICSLFCTFLKHIFKLGV